MAALQDVTVQPVRLEEHKGWYLYIPAEQHLWIVPAKCASTSFSQQDTFVKYLGVERMPWTRAFIVVRHPWQRLVSALNMVRSPLTTDYALKHARTNDPHFWPYVRYIGGRENVVPIRVETLSLPLPRLNVGNSPSWESVQIDWAALLAIYGKDFELCPQWSLFPSDN